ncbi:hypothetical protein N5079_19785 [Planotetraspora sp. A-T 1434]|uniref:hypothetical protein n=1 Tax=Planotetraspora sp. A-T 1434 TaxID=2979219 RepID=UPI0021C17E9F|nr:hypothetical protein [Planotetraspora sp. A-T 1434]MCT9932446.1 hypothetical protein [Planotetraspora sp. A-T 1434]
MSATGYTSGDPTKVSKSGDTVDGNLTLGTGAASRQLILRSSYTGGDDDGGPAHFDSTSRIELESYQRAQTNGYGEVIRVRSRRARSKQMFAWYGPTAYTPYNAATDTGGDPIGQDEGWAWIGAHYLSTEGDAVHGHLSIETPDTLTALRTRLEFAIWDPVSGAYGMDKTLIRTNAADFQVRCTNSAVLRLSGGVLDKKPIEWSNSDVGQVSGIRWQLRTDGSAEGGSNAGSDLELVRFNDSGVAQDSPLVITRQNGRITIGGSSGSGAGLTINRNAASASAITIAHTGTGGTGMAVTAADVTSSVVRGQISGDTVARAVVFADGKHEWGSGTASRDTNLYRNGTDQLKTDDSLVVGARLAVGQALGSDAIAVTTDGTISAALLKASALGTASRSVLAIETNDVTKRAFDYRLTGDSVSRIRMDASASSSGTIIFGDGTTADTNIYRAAADTLKTDDSFHVGTTFRHLGTSLGFYNAAAIARPTVTGSRGGNAALASFLTQMAALGLITDSTTA